MAHAIGGVGHTPKTELCGPFDTTARANGSCRYGPTPTQSFDNHNTVMERESGPRATLNSYRPGGCYQTSPLAYTLFAGPISLALGLETRSATAASYSRLRST